MNETVVEKRDWSLMGSSYVCGIIDEPNAYLRPIDVWLAMTERPPVRDFKSNKAIYWGDMLELPIIRSFESDHEIELIVNNNIVSPKNKLHCTTPDGTKFKDSPLLLEVKNVDGRKRYMWIEGPHTLVQAQCQWHMKIFNEYQEHNNGKPVECCFVRALFGGNDHEDFVIPFDKELVECISTIADDFIKNYVLTDKEPPVDASKSYRKYLFTKFPNLPEKPEKNQELFEVSDEKVINSAYDIISLSKQINELTEELELQKNFLISHTGERYGIKITGIGKFLYYGVRGKVSESKVIKQLQEKFKIPIEKIEEIKENCRGKNYRVPRLYPLKKL